MIGDFFKSHIRGYSLVEMMIALLLSSSLLAALGYWYVEAKTSWLLADGHSNVAQNGRIALQTLVGAVQRAGYVKSPVPSFHDSSHRGRHYTFGVHQSGAAWGHVQVLGGRSTLAQGITGIDMATVDSDSDILVIRYQAVNRLSPNGTSAAVNCVGNPLEEGDVVTEIYYVRSASDETSLACQSIRPNRFSDRPSTVVKGVSALKILYGERLRETGVLRYRPDVEVLDWSAVSAVKIALRVGASNEIYGAARDSYRYSLLDPDVIYESDGDSHLAAIFSQTVALRN